MSAFVPLQPQLPPEPFAVEAQLGAIGIAPFLGKSLKQVHGYHRDRAAATAADVERRIGRFLSREEPEPIADLPAFDFGEVRSMLGTPTQQDNAAEVHPEHVQQQIAAFGEDGEMALAIQLQVQRIRAYLEAKLPHRTYNGLAGPEEGEPPRIEVARFRRIWAIANDPLSVLTDLNEFALSRDQAQACADLYPAIWGSFAPAMQRQLVQRKTVNPKWTLPRRKETLLRVLTRNEAPNVPLAQAVQAIYAETPAAPKPAAKKADKAAGSMSEATAAERIEQG